MAFLYCFTEWGIKYFDCKKRLILESLTKGNICRPTKFLFLSYWRLFSKIYRLRNWTWDNYLKVMWRLMAYALLLFWAVSSVFIFLLINQQPEVPAKLPGTSGSSFHAGGTAGMHYGSLPGSVIQGSCPSWRHRSCSQLRSQLFTCPGSLQDFCVH